MNITETSSVCSTTQFHSLPITFEYCLKNIQCIPPMGTQSKLDFIKDQLILKTTYYSKDNIDWKFEVLCTCNEYSPETEKTNELVSFAMRKKIILN